jgi:serine phosphatase RsbU (regulator of sigma subunit)/predicted ester cyclase
MLEYIPRRAVETIWRGGRPVSAEENKALVRRFFEAQVEGNLPAMEEVMADDFVDHSVLPGQDPGREGYLRLEAEDRASFSDIRRDIEDQIADGDKVITRLTISGTHDRGPFAGAAPTGTEMFFTAIVIHRVSRGKIVEEWSESGGTHEITQRRLEQEIHERARVEQELQVARRIQHALLPKSLPNLRGWDIAHHYRPAREVGGDFYDFLGLPDGHLGLVVGDATGHGVPAALMMANTQSVIRAVAQRGGSEPGRMLAEVNEVLWNYMPPGMFVTCFYGVLDAEGGHFRYANAGHNLPFCRRENLAIELRATGMPLGLMPGMGYEEKETEVLPGESILIYSDGLVEAHNPEFEMFGSPRLRSLLAEPVTGPKDLTSFLLEELGRFTGESWDQEDDITLVALRRFPNQAAG